MGKVMDQVGELALGSFGGDLEGFGFAHPPVQ